MPNNRILWIQVFLVAVLLLTSCAGAGDTDADATDVPIEVLPTPAMETEAPTEPATQAPTQAATKAPTEAPTQAATVAPTEAATQATGGEEPAGALVSVAVDQAPELDGSGEDDAWADAPEVSINVTGGANMGSTTVTLKSVYTGEQVFFLAVWEDPTESFLRAPWVKQQDGTWVKQRDPNDKGGDDNQFYEDKLAFIWEIGDTIPNFETQGCFVACHAGENPDVKPYGNKYLPEEGQLGDIWHWKGVRNLGQIDDQYLDHMPYSADNPGAGRHSDPNTGGGYVDNQTEDRSKPAFMPPNGGDKTGAPGFILDAEKVPFDDTLFAAGDMVPSIIIAEFQGDRGNISAEWEYADGQWTLEFSRDLVTDSEFDVQFDDLAAQYHFGVAVFDNAQVRHAFQAGVTPFVFRAGQ